MRRTCATLAFLLVLESARLASADDRSVWHRISIAGSATFAASYGLAFGLGARYREARLYVPVIGPLLELGRCRDCAGSPYEQPVLAFLIVDALAQGVGMALMARRWYKTRPRAQISVAPTFLASGGGLVAVGEF